MIGKILRGTRVQGLIRYLYGPGRCAEHHDPHLVAGFRSPAALEPPVDPDGGRDFSRLDGLMTQPIALLGARNYRKPVWHVPVRAAPEDPILTDQQWAQIAAEFMDRTGLAPEGDPDGVRWVAVRHADDHIHLVATLARADGIRPDVWNDGYRVRDACLAVEKRFGLRRTAPADRSAARRPKRGETEKARRQGRTEAARVTLRRHVTTAAASARNETEFFARLRSEGVLVHERNSQRDPEQVTGYAVALPGDLNQSGRPVFYGGSKLAADLTLPKLRFRWLPEGNPSGVPRSADYHSVAGKYLSERSARAVLRNAVRKAADQTRNAPELLSRLEAEGLLVRRRFSRTNPDEITGYAVALPDHCGPDGQPHWYGGGSLAEDLSFPRLQRRWLGDSAAPRAPGPTDPDLTVEERQAFYADAARTADHATAQIRRHLVLAPHAARDACWAASDVLYVAAKATGNQHLRRAAEAYDRAGRLPYGRIPRPSPAGNALRTAARLLAMAGFLDANTMAVITLAASLIALLDTIDQLHRAQQRATHATATRSAREHLRRGYPAAASQATLSDHSPTNLARADFPVPWAPMRPAGRCGQAPQPPRSSDRSPEPPGPKPPKRRGPTV